MLNVLHLGSSYCDVLTSIPEDSKMQESITEGSQATTRQKKKRKLDEILQDVVA